MTVLQNTGSLTNVGEAAGLLSVMGACESGPSIKQLEQTLAAWWQELLGLEHVGVDDDFFQLGGHSLIGVALFAKIKEAYGVELELSTLFDAKTVAELAQVVNQNLNARRPQGNHPPTTKGLEETLAAWWQELLGLEHVGVDDDFFQLGGHSLIGVALFAKIKEAYGVELELSTLFDAKTVAELARVVNQNLNARRPQGNHPPTTKELEETLAAWWQELLGLEHVGVDDDFFQLGGHSLIGVALFAKIKEAYGVELELSTLFDAKTVAELAQVLVLQTGASPQEAKTWQYLTPLQPHGKRAPLFWVPGGYGTSLLAFREVSLLLGSDQPVYGFQATMPEEGREMESVPDRAARFVKELREFQPQGPYYLVGFCAGGFMAFEMAQQLVASGQTVAFLGLIECYDDRFPNTWFKKAQYRYERIVWRTGQVLGSGPKGTAKWVFGHTASVVRRLGAILAGKPPAPLPPSEADIFEKLYPSLRRYHAVNYPGKSVLLIGKDSYQYCGLSQSVDPRLVWSRLSASGSEIKIIPGDHMELLQGAIVHRLADALKQYLPA